MENVSGIPYMTKEWAAFAAAHYATKQLDPTCRAISFQQDASRSLALTSI
jgi:hypothetical protein